MLGCVHGLSDDSVPVVLMRGGERERERGDREEEGREGGEEKGREKRGGEEAWGGR